MFTIDADGDEHTLHARPNPLPGGSVPVDSGRARELSTFPVRGASPCSSRATPTNAAAPSATELSIVNTTHEHAPTGRAGARATTATPTSTTNTVANRALISGVPLRLTYRPKLRERRAEPGSR